MKISEVWRWSAEHLGAFGRRLFRVTKKRRRLFEKRSTVVGMMISALVIRYVDWSIWPLVILMTIALWRFWGREYIAGKIPCAFCGEPRCDDEGELCSHCSVAYDRVTSSYGVRREILSAEAMMQELRQPSRDRRPLESDTLIPFPLAEVDESDRRRMDRRNQPACE